MRISSNRWRRLARRLQPGAAARQPRPGAAPHVSAEAQHADAGPFRSVYLTGKLTGVVAVWVDKLTSLLLTQSPESTLVQSQGIV